MRLGPKMEPCKHSCTCTQNAETNHQCSTSPGTQDLTCYASRSSHIASEILPPSRHDPSLFLHQHQTAPPILYQRNENDSIIEQHTARQEEEDEDFVVCYVLEQRTNTDNNLAHKHPSNIQAVIMQTGNMKPVPDNRCDTILVELSEQSSQL